MKLTLDTDAETSMIKASLAHSLGLVVEKSSQKYENQFQKALQADGTTTFAVIGEVHVSFPLSNNQLVLDAFVVEDLGVDILAGIPFLMTDDISVRPATQQMTVLH